MNENDLRVQKTHLLLRNTFLEMMETKQFEDITVSELCDKALIRRSTFYRHYNDKYDYLNKLIEDFMMRVRALHINQYNPKHPEDYFYQFLNDILAFMNDNKKLVHAIANINFHNEVAEIYYDQIYKVVTYQVEADEQAGIQFIVDKKTYIEFLSGGIYRVIYQWLMERQQRPSSDISNEIVELITLLRERVTKLI
ncbi:TetR/AcrR family transcriptional regulator [Staphylococcus condimenti]|uniref:TetR/AcrR family transcriptional regulator n=1 Tax=Staphylococcus condimenti TaxID=70255 RepID=A0A4Q7CRA0_9STAP|nr:TetR/AcrR family transcriptional regulator C-terminal domain-containing protein [Staphylococcus condimenti]RZI04962.1 TetR/AcrR family transcriptional regulator [Staphylococcus condimenti]RZI05813.1 TetR/AcrR family transcriptional regulator [Staphylococcus condimenti]